jgi:hypothetical protein
VETAIDLAIKRPAAICSAAKNWVTDRALQMRRAVDRSRLETGNI